MHRGLRSSVDGRLADDQVLLSADCDLPSLWTESVELWHEKLQTSPHESQKRGRGVPQLRYPYRMKIEQDGPANGSQPVRSETYPTSSRAGPVADLWR
jgi:hypothetical protein